MAKILFWCPKFYFCFSQIRTIFANKTTPMAELLKNIYNLPLLEHFAKEWQKVDPKLDTKGFLNQVFSPEWEGLELKQRMRHISQSMRPFLPDSYTNSIVILLRVNLALRMQEKSEFNFPYIFLSDFVEVYGLEEFSTSMMALESFTQLSSAEFAVRPFLIRYPEDTMQKMLSWASHKEPMVRRLSSEGSRPRLPWGMRVPFLIEKPYLTLPILEQLKNDPNETVRRSVANHLNDISKDHPEIVLSIAEKWLDQHTETDWIIRHACRGLLKKGNTEALSHFGWQKGIDLGINHLAISSDSLHIGDSLTFSFELRLNKTQNQKLRLEFAIDYVKANGKWSRKVFQLTDNVFEGNKTYRFEKKHSFEERTTRKHYIGTHRLAILVNGEEKKNISFELK
jgi:3-methyladenine DNA glycosylase AlkC